MSPKAKRIAIFFTYVVIAVVVLLPCLDLITGFNSEEGLANGLPLTIHDAARILYGGSIVLIFKALDL